MYLCKKDYTKNLISNSHTNVLVVKKEEYSVVIQCIDGARMIEVKSELGAWVRTIRVRPGFPFEM